MSTDIFGDAEISTRVELQLFSQGKSRSSMLQGHSVVSSFDPNRLRLQCPPHGKEQNYEHLRTIFSNSLLSSRQQEMTNVASLKIHPVPSDLTLCRPFMLGSLTENQEKAQQVPQARLLVTRALSAIQRDSLME